jgi:hypothetical protein
VSEDTRQLNAQQLGIPLRVFLIKLIDTSGDDGEEEEEFDNASQGSRFVSDHHLSDDEEDSDLAQHGFHIQNMIAC